MSERWSLFAPENSQLLEEARQKSPEFVDAAIDHARTTHKDEG